MITKFEICSQALLSLGEAPISSFTANDGASIICGQIYPSYIKYLLSLYPWNFTFNKVQLAKLVDAPLNNWKYQYQIPLDLLVLNTVYNSSNITIFPTQDYQVFGDKIMSNEKDLYIDYQRQVDELEFPTYFTEFAIKALAYKLAMPVTQDKQLHDTTMVVAFGNPSDKMQGGEFGNAKNIDSMQTPNQRIVADELLNSRFY